MHISQARRHVRRAQFQLADWVVQPSVDRISRGEEVVHLRPKLMDVLVFLAGRPGAVITKEELLEAVWPQLFIEESALARVIADLRRLLGDDARRPAIIETIPKRGYRLVAAVKDAAVAAAAVRVQPLPVTPLPFRLGSSVGRARPVFIGREDEVARLGRMLNAACDGAGSIAFVTGDVGTGKTALLAEFVRRAQHSCADLVVAQGKASMPGAANDPYSAFREVLGLITGDVEPSLAAGVLDEKQAERLWQLIPSSVRILTDVSPDLLDTLVPATTLLARARAAVATADCDWLSALEQHVARAAGARPTAVRCEDLVSQAVDLLQALSREHPLLLVLDDLQWADAASVALMAHLASEAASYRMLIVGAYRPADVAAAVGTRHPLEATVHEMVRRFGEVIIALPEQGDQAFVDGLVDTQPNRFGPEFRRTLFKQTGGHPLFTVELLRAMREAGALSQDTSGCWEEAGELDWDALPARVEAAVAERVARLPRPVRRMLDAASVEGEQFTAEVVARVAGISAQDAVLTLGDEVEKRHRLARLQSVCRINDRRVSIYSFEHVVTQRYLIGTLDQAQRAYLHEAVGNALEAIYGPGVETIAARLAWHFEQAGIVPKAIDYLRQAGERALRLSADQEAVSHFGAAIGLLAALPASTGQDAAELRFRLALLVPLMRLTSGLAPQLMPAIERVHELIARLPAGADTFSASTALMLFHGMRGEYARAIEAADLSVATAGQIGHPALVAASRWLPGAIRLRTGELERSRADLSSAPPDAGAIDPGITAALVHPEVWRLCWLGYCLWFMGYPDQALARVRQAVSFAERIADRGALVSALVVQTSILLHRREGAAAQQALDAVLQTGPVTDFLRVAIPYLQGWSLAETGHVEDGLAHLQRAIAVARQFNVRLDCTKFLATVAATALKAGQNDRAAAAAAEGLDAATTTGEHYYEAELHRLQGEAMLAAGCPRADAERDLKDALRIAREQKARSWELRAATSLARLWSREGLASEARATLSAVYDWFTEGFDTGDLQAARELLSDLHTRQHHSSHSS